MRLADPYVQSPPTALDTHKMSLTHYGSMPPTGEFELLMLIAAYLAANVATMLTKAFAPALRVAAPVTVSASVTVAAPVCVEAVPVCVEAVPVCVEAVPVTVAVPVCVEAVPVTVAAPLPVVEPVVAAASVVAMPDIRSVFAAPVRVRGRVPSLDTTYKHHFSKLGEVIPYGTKVFMKNSGEKRSAIFTAEGFKKGNYTFKSPNAWGVAFASRITEAHPWPTKPGVNSWYAIKIEDGPYAGKSIAEAYDLHFAH
jgi:hypothetical protein